jgi:hypothetical protein
MKCEHVRDIEENVMGKSNEGLDLAAEDSATHHKKPPVAASMIAPAATMVAAWGVRKALGIGYRTATGHKPPLAQDREVSLVQVLVWTVVSATAVAVVEVLVVRAVTQLASSD